MRSIKIFSRGNKVGKKSVNERVVREFDAVFYLKSNQDIAQADIDPLKHYLKHGWSEGRAPNEWFDPTDFIKKHPELVPDGVNPFYVYLESFADEPETGSVSKPDAGSGSVGQKPNQLLLQTEYDHPETPDAPSPVVISIKPPTRADVDVAKAGFDVEYYLKTYPDVEASGVDPILHYLSIGWIEGRDPSAEFSTRFYLSENLDIARSRTNPFLHYLIHGKKETWRRSASVADAPVWNLFRNDADMMARVAAAVDLEPMVALPNAVRSLTSAQTAAKTLTDAVQAIREKLGTRQYRYIITVPHIRMSGAARVATLLTSALAQIRNPDEILLVTTDSSEDEYGFWLPKEIDRLDLSVFTDGLPPEHRMRCLIDLLRGTACQTLINVNSKLAWDMLTGFGRQISQEMNIITYLFTWEETPEGKRVGYPIQWLRDTAEFHHLLLTDSQNLATDIENRLGFTKAHGAEVVPIYTPAPQGDEITPHRPDTKPGVRPRFLWAGRFDRQKRVDLLVEIARANPQYDFDVYGKAVLDKTGIEAFNPPDNIYPKGTYTQLSEVLNVPYAGFMYTAQWDGIPTILLDMSCAGLPIVAPDVGGISELVGKDCGWLIEQFDDVNAYSKALAEMAGDPDDAQLRNKRLQAVIEKTFSTQHYISSIREAMEQHGL